MKNSLFHGFACLPLGNWEFLKLISKLTQAVCCIVPFFIPTHPADCWYTLPLTLIVLINMKAPLPGHRTMLRVCYVLWFNQCACLLVYFNNLKKGKLKTVTNCTHKHTEQSKQSPKFFKKKAEINALVLFQKELNIPKFTDDWDYFNIPRWHWIGS